jgi:hypothetical protein
MDNALAGAVVDDLQKNAFVINAELQIRHE